MAKRRVIISERDNIAALFEGDLALEFIIHRGDILLGDVYLAEVENILPSIDAAFVNVGGDKMGFLHSSDVQGKGELKSRLKPKQRLVVQVMKEPTGHKGPRVTTNISLPGRFLVLMPESRGVSISRKIESAAERNRLKSLVSLIKPSGVGIIIRTEADNVSESDIQEDFEVLIERWQNIVSMADSADPPSLLYRDQDLLYRVVRETVNEDVNELVVDTSFGFQRAQQLLQNWNLDKAIKVTQYTGQQSIMVAMGVEREIRQALLTKVPMPSGGYLYIQPTEALCVVDVNSGRFTSLQSQADTIRITNLEAAKEVARQLRLRNIGGMIVVDFIDMESRADQLAILQAFEAALADDKAKPQLGQLTDLGLVEMTRHRQGQALSEIFTRNCVHCTGTGNMLDPFSWASSSAPEGEGKGFDFRNRRHNSPPRQASKPGGRTYEGRGGSSGSSQERDRGDQRPERGERPDRNDRNDRGDRAERPGAVGNRPDTGPDNRGNDREQRSDARPEQRGERSQDFRSTDRGESQRPEGRLGEARSEQRPDSRGERRPYDGPNGERASERSADRAGERNDSRESRPDNRRPYGDRPEANRRPEPPVAEALIWPRPVTPAPTAPAHEPALVDQYDDQLLERFGVTLGRYVKMAWLPQEANANLSRYNPRVNDILTLVASIEGGTSPQLEPEELPDEDETRAEEGLSPQARFVQEPQPRHLPDLPELFEFSSEDSQEPALPETDGPASGLTDESPAQQDDPQAEGAEPESDEEGDGDDDAKPRGRSSRGGGRRKRSTPRRRSPAGTAAASSDG